MDVRPLYYFRPTMPTDSDLEKENEPFSARPPRYHSYILRFWEERSKERAAGIWRFSLEDPVTDQRYGFAELNALVNWIRERIIA